MRNSMKHRQHNGQKTKDTIRRHKAKDGATRTQLKRNVNYGAPVG